MKILAFLIVTQMAFATTTVLGSGSGNISTEDVDDVTVAFNNRLPQNENFTIHCTSQEHDLGSHVIAPSSYYEFSFEVNFFRTTYFICSLRWQEVEAAFYAYRVIRDLNRCSHYCLWNVKEDGVEGFREGGGTQPDIIVSWKWIILAYRRISYGNKVIITILKCNKSEPA